MSNENSPDAKHQAEIDLRDVFYALWQSKWIIIIMTVAFAILSVTISLSLPNMYRSQAVLSPVEESAGGLNLGGQLGGLASLAGVDLGPQSSNKLGIALEVLNSTNFKMRFIEKHSLTEEVVAATGWSLETNELIFDDEIYSAETDKWVRQVEPPKKTKPSLLEAAGSLSEYLTVSNNAETGMVTVAVEYYSPYVAKKWVDWLVHDVNEYMREREQIEATKSINYLNEQLSKTNIADVRTVLFELIEEQQKTLMFTEVRDEYIFETVDSAVTQEEKSKPSRALICIIGTLLGGVLAAFYVITRFFWTRN